MLNSEILTVFLDENAALADGMDVHIFLINFHSAPLALHAFQSCRDVARRDSAALLDFRNLFAAWTGEFDFNGPITPFRFTILGFLFVCGTPAERSYLLAFPTFLPDKPLMGLDFIFGRRWYRGAASRIGISIF